MNANTIRPCVLVLLVFAHGCAGLHGVARPAPAGECAREAALPDDLLEPGSVLLFGEIHGTAELPRFFGEAVCTAAASGLAVEVGLEVAGAEQPSVDAFLASPGGAADVEALAATDFWSRDYQDGRSSQAMVALLDHMRRLRASGLPLHVFLFDLDPGEDMSRRDEAMAANIAAHARAHPVALTMALTGEVHSWKTRGAPWDPELLPMGWHLDQAGIRVRSLGRATPAGTAWICTGGSPSDCGSKETRATGTLPSGRAAGIELLPEPSPRGYAGMYATSSLTASPPARLPPQSPPEPR